MPAGGVFGEISAQPEGQSSRRGTRRIKRAIYCHTGRQRVTRHRGGGLRPVRRTLFFPNVAEPVYDRVPKLGRTGCFVEKRDGAVSARLVFQPHGDLIRDIRSNVEIPRGLKMKDVRDCPHWIEDRRILPMFPCSSKRSFLRTTIE